MIVYCPNCQIVFDENARCPVCGRKRVRQPLPEDVCFLTETDPIPGAMLRDVLQQNGIPSLDISTLGAAMALRAGSMLERLRLYVRYDHLQKAKELAEELLRTGLPVDERPGTAEE